jgi:hypothetical protein
MSAEWHFRLAASQYVHDGAGVIEFAGITLALWLAIRRTRGIRSPSAVGYLMLGWGVAIGYPVLGVSYLFGVGGGIVEAVFFLCFSAMVLFQLHERLHGRELPAGGGRRLAGQAGDEWCERLSS